MSDHIDEAFVDIKPDVKDFDRELNRELTSSLKNVERKLDDVVDSIEKNFDHLIKDLEVHFHHLTVTVDDAFDSIRRDAAHAGESIGVDIDAGARVAKHAIDDLADDAGRDFARLRRKSRDEGLGTGRGFLRGILDSLQNAGGQVGSALGSVFSGAGGAIGSIFGGGGDIFGSIKIGLIVAAVPVVIALAGALSQLLGLLLLIPAAVGVLVAAIAPLIIGFKGLGEAIGAGLSGDTEKFNEALKSLAPSARAVVKEITAFKKPFAQLKHDVQQALFSELVGQIKPLLKDVIPVLGKGLVYVAGALSSFAAGFVELLHSSPVLNAINALFMTTMRIINDLSPSILFFIETMFKLLQAGLPWIERFADSFAVALTKFSDFLADAVNAGKFTTWVENAVRVMGELWDLLKAVGGLLKTLFVGTADSGEDFIVKLTDAINKLNDFFSNTKEGKETLEVLAKSVKFTATAIVGLAVAIGNVLRWINEFVHWLVEAWNWLKSVGSAIGNFFAGIGSALASAWNAVTTWVANAWNAIVGFFTALPGRIMAGLSALPGVLRDAAVKAFDQFFFAIGFGIGKVIAFFRDLPLRVMIILAAFWEDAKRVTSEGVNAVVNFFSSLPGRVANFVDSMKLRVAVLIAETKNVFVNRVTELVNGAVSTASSLPGRIWGVLSSIPGRLYSLGQDMIRGIINGIGSMVDALVNTAKRAVEKAWEGAKKALGISSPSKEFAKLGVQSVRGFEMGMNDESDDASRRTPGFPPDVFGGRGTPSETKTATQASAGTTLIAYLQIGDDQLHPVVVRSIEEHPQEIALATERGNTKLDRRR